MGEERVTLVVADAQKELLREGVSGPGGVIRVAVGRLGFRSSIWRVWAGPVKIDVYVAARSLGEYQKFSLHESGDWRQQWRTSEHALKYTGQSRRTIDRWARPAEWPGGWTPALSIWVPPGGLSEVPDDRPPKRGGVTYLPEPAPGHALGMHVVLAATDRGYVKTGGTLPVAAFWIASAEVVLLVAERRELTDKDLAWLRGNHEQAVARLPEEQRPKAGLRVTLHGRDDHGIRWIWDLADTTPG